MININYNETTDFSDENIQAHEMLQNALNKGYNLRIDDLEVSVSKVSKIISLKPNNNYVKQFQLDLLKRLEETVSRQYVDVEATEKHLEAKLKGDELEMRILNMRIEADDTADTLKPISEAITREREKLENISSNNQVGEGK